MTILGNELAFIKFSAFVVLLFFMNCASMIYEVNALNAQCKKMTTIPKDYDLYLDNFVAKKQEWTV